jgi:2-polyprenyl-3-methyl-5-hydroxy-6-metoxy-1,4-benzoquinol methylase
MATDRDPIRRDSFDSVAEAYDRGRPSYPERLVDDLIALANIGERSRVLEIGPGTGQISVPLAKRGASLVAVERGRNLAEVARRKLSRFKHADIVVADFDRWEAAPAAFDAVVAATAFHWLDPSTRLPSVRQSCDPAARSPSSRRTGVWPKVTIRSSRQARRATPAGIQNTIPHSNRSVPKTSHNRAMTWRAQSSHTWFTDVTSALENTARPSIAICWPPSRMFWPSKSGAVLAS